MYYQNIKTAEALQELVENRHQMAQILGFESFSSRALLTAAPKNPAEVDYFLRTLSDKFRPFVDAEKNNLAKNLNQARVRDFEFFE